MKKYKKYVTLILALLLVVCLPINSIASEWRIGTPWKKIGPNVTLAVPLDRVGIGLEIPNNRLQVAGLINFDDARWGTFLGFQAGNVNTGSVNSFIGYQAGLLNTTGESNTFIGTRAGLGNTTGGRNAFIGAFAGRSNTTGFDNTFIGSDVGFFASTGHSNTFIGMAAGYWNEVGHSNTFTGLLAGGNNSTGFNNTFIGRYAGTFLADRTANSTSNNSVFMGFDTRASAAGNTNEIIIGANATGSGSNSITLGNPSIARTVLRGNTTMWVAIPGTPTVTPQPLTGTTTWGYRVTAQNLVGETLASAEGRTTTGLATLGFDALGNPRFNRITWTAAFGAVNYRIYRTTAGGTPSTTGLIGTTTGIVFDDRGLAALGAIPTVDTSGSVGIGTPSPATGNKLEVHDGHIVNTMTTPPVATCNVGIPSIIGTDMGGAITTPATATACTITFTIPWNQIYACVVSGSTSTAAPFVSALSNTAATFTYVTTGTPTLYYHCSGR